MVDPTTCRRRARGRSPSGAGWHAARGPRAAPAGPAPKPGAPIERERVRRRWRWRGRPPRGRPSRPRPPRRRCPAGRGSGPRSRLRTRPAWVAAPVTKSTGAGLAGLTPAAGLIGRPASKRAGQQGREEMRVRHALSDEGERREVLAADRPPERSSSHRPGHSPRSGSRTAAPAGSPGRRRSGTCRRAGGPAPRPARRRSDRWDRRRAWQGPRHRLEARLGSEGRKQDLLGFAEPQRPADRVPAAGWQLRLLRPRRRRSAGK